VTVLSAMTCFAMVAASMASSSQPDARAPRGHETVLLVEDEPAVREMTQEALQRHGYTVLRHGIETGDADFLQMPFSTSVLAAKLRRVLDR